MDLRREKRKENRILGILITLLAVCFAVISAVIISLFSAPELTEDYAEIGGLDSRAETVSAGFYGLSGKLNAKDEFSFEINGEIVFDDCNSAGKLLLKNPFKNRYLMQLDIAVDDEIVLSTGYIAPGQMIKEAKPDIELSAGEYEAVAHISAIDPQSGEKLDTVEQNILLIIKK